MATYVDVPVQKISKNPKARFAGKRFGHRWAHMLADTLPELHAMAEKIGLAPEWFQKHPRFPHYDISPKKRAMAIELGAKEMRTADILRQIALKMLAEKQSVEQPLTEPEREELDGVLAVANETCCEHYERTTGGNAGDCPGEHATTEMRDSGHEFLADHPVCTRCGGDASADELGATCPGRS